MSLPRYAEYRHSGIPWIGEMPGHWITMPLKAIASGLGATFIDGDWIESRNLAESGVRYITTGNVGVGVYKEQGAGYISNETFNELRCTAVQPGDVLISRLNMPIGRACLAPDLGVRVVTSVDNVIVRPASQFDRRWLVFRLSSPDYLYEAGTIASGATMQRISRSELGRMRLAFPPLNEQAAIARFLDRETAKIDALIAEQEKLIALLAEKRQATISHAVTKGLNPNAPMKHSGVLWLGEVPTHWAIKRVKHLVKEGIAGPYGSSLTKSMYSASGYRVYGQQQVIPGDFSMGDYYISEKQFAEMSRYQVRPNDVLISVMGTIGRSAVVPQDAEAGIINPRLVLYRVIERLICPNYLQTFLNNPTSQRYFSLAAQGTTMEGLNMGSIGELHVALPPLHEQQEILQFVQNEVAKLDALSVESDRAVALFKERRSALIAAAVTGQIDVRGEVAEVAA